MKEERKEGRKKENSAVGEKVLFANENTSNSTSIIEVYFFAFGTSIPKTSI